MRVPSRLSRLCVFLAIAAVGGALIWGATAALSASYETICWEAEDHNTITQPLFVGPRTHADDAAAAKAGPSGGKFVRSDLKSENDSGGKVVYKVKVGGGTYKVWARRYWPMELAGCANSFYINVDGKRVGIFGEDATYGDWKWTSLKKPTTLSLTPGVHTIEFEHREHGAIVDQILLTTRTTRYVPGGGSLTVKPTPGAVQN
jgi:hypothetical protein